MHSMLQKLPVELLEAIIDHLPSRKDRRSLWQVFRTLRELLTARVFETITIRAKEHALLRLDSRPYYSLNATRPLDCLKLVKHLHLKAPFHEKLDEDDRCPHHELYNRLPMDPDTRERPNVAPARLPKLIPLFLQLQENGLASFSWDLGMCIPEHVLGREGYLTKRQTAIESLSLITGVSGEHYADPSLGVETVVLSGFLHIRKFSWKGLRLTEELNSLRDLFAGNFKILEELELDFIDWSLVSIDGTCPAGSLWLEPIPSFTDIILPHRSNGKVKRFASLKRLALSGFGFEDATRKISQAFNISLLQSLKLNHCTGILIFLSTIVDAGVVLKLKSLELIIGDNAVERGGVLESPLISFLQSFEGLEDLYLMLRADRERPDHWLSHYWNAILHHSSTLKRLIYHERTTKYFEVGEGVLQERWADNCMMYKRFLSGDAETDAFNNHIYNTALAQLQLECFGVSDDPLIFQIIMGTPLAVEKDFKLLHIRLTGTDPVDDPLGEHPGSADQMHALSQDDPGSWSRDQYLHKMVEKGMHHRRILRLALMVFQSPTFNNLQVLAFGDFSHGGRYKWGQLLLCRAVTANPEVAFRVMSHDDIAFYKRSGLLSADFLSALPRNTLLDSQKWDDFP